MGLLVVGLAFTAAAVLVTLAVAALFFKIVLRLILLPLLLVKFILMGVVILVAGPVLFLVGLAAFFVAGLVLTVPLLPLAALGVIVWLLVRENRRPAVA